MEVNFIKNIVAHISSVPPLPAAAQKLVELSSKSDVDINEISKVIAMDQGITSKLLQVVNSPFYAFSNNVTTISQAITLLGLNAIRSLALSVSVIKFKKSQVADYYFSPEEFWRHSLATAVLSKRLALLLKYPEPEEAFIAGLMHDIGKLVLSEFVPEPYSLTLQQASKAEKELNEYEEEIFEMDHAMLGEELCRHWMIPERIRKAIALHHQSLFMEDPMADKEANRLAKLVSVANQLTHCLELGKSGNELVSLDFIAFLENEKISFSTLLKEIEQAKAELDASASLFGFKTEETPEEKLLQIKLQNLHEAQLLQLVLISSNFKCVDENLQALPILLVHDSSVTGLDLENTKRKNILPFDFEAWKTDRVKENKYPMYQLKAEILKSLE